MAQNPSVGVCVTQTWGGPETGDRSVPVSRDGAACTENHYDVRRGQESERVGGSPGPGLGQGREVAWAHQSSLPPNIVLLPPD